MNTTEAMNHEDNDAPRCRCCGQKWSDHPGQETMCRIVSSMSSDLKVAKLRNEQLLIDRSLRTGAPSKPSAAHSVADQPNPSPNDNRPVWELVIEDMNERDAVGRVRYGTPLQAFNGRDALVDAYQEALDLVVYLKQSIVERETMGKQLDNLKEQVMQGYLSHSNPPSDQNKPD